MKTAGWNPPRGTTMINNVLPTALSAADGTNPPSFSQWDYPGTFLSQYPKNAQSTIANLFCNAVREGAKTVEKVILAVERDLIQRQEWGVSERHCLAPIIRELQSAVVDSKSDAANFAAFILWRESLTPAEKDKLKTQKGKEFLAARMSTEPPSAAQLSYLQCLNCPIIPTTKLEASQLIENIRNEQQ